jgi:fatty acid synthase subunit beta, fungi type
MVSLKPPGSLINAHFDLGFLISDIVKRNPKSLTVYFGGRRGTQIRQNYMDIMVESNGKPEKFFKSIDETTIKYTFKHSAGLLFSTEFAQPALTVMERAQFLHLNSKGVVSPHALFAGHSLGEYSALSTIGQIMPFEKLLAVVFYRGLTMQSAVNRDAKGRSNFSMMAVNPSRISRHMSTEHLQGLIKQIVSALDGDLLEIVNYNVATQQYVAAGTLAALDCLTIICNAMAADPTTYLASGPSAATPSEALTTLITSTATATKQKPFPIPLTRGAATVPLEGIDVPFHSSFLLPKMPAFRRVLEKYITPEAIDAKLLKGKYVSNVTGKAFDTSYEAVQEVYEQTGSVVLRDLLEEMEGYA